MSNFIVMRSGNRINLNAPRKDLILASDIAEQLAKSVMDRGAAWGFYTKAQHSLLVAQEAARREGPLVGMYALLHHAHEVYGETFERPAFLAVLYGAFDLDWDPPKGVKTVLAQAHDTVTMTELRQLWTGRDREVAEFEHVGTRPLRSMIKPIGQWDRVKDRFLDALRVYAVAADLPQNLPAWGAL